MENIKPNKKPNFWSKLKPFFDFRIENLEDVISILLGFGVFSLIIFRIYSFDITYDEAYTYLNTGRIQDVWKIYQFRIANTHLLNSLLMTVTTLFLPYNDVAIRLPILFISALYIAVSISISKKYQNRLIVLGLLLLFYYVIQYMALARGYGMSATFILAALFVYKEKENFHSYYLWVAYLFLLAIYSNYVALIPFFVVMAYMFIVDFKGRLPVISTKNKRWLMGLTVLSIYGFYSVTKAGKPMPTTTKHTFIEAIPHDILSRFLDVTTIPIPFVTIGVLVLSILVVAVYFIDKGKNVFGVITLITFSIVFIATWAGDKQLPSGRVLIPYWPLIVFLIVEILEATTTKIRIPKLILRVLNIAILGLLIFNFQSQMLIAKYVQSKSGQWKTNIEVMSRYGKEIFNHNPYYLEKDWKHNITRKNLQKIIPNKVIENSGVKFQIYNAFRLITVSFNVPTENIRLYRLVIQQNESIYSDTISLNSYIYGMEQERMMLLPFPAFGGDVLRVGNIDGSWEESFIIPKRMEGFFPPEQPSF